MICRRCACASNARSGVTRTPDETASITSSFCLSNTTAWLSVARVSAATV